MGELLGCTNQRASHYRLIMTLSKRCGFLNRERTCAACNFDTWNAQASTSVSLSFYGMRHVEDCVWKCFHKCRNGRFCAWNSLTNLHLWHLFPIYGTLCTDRSHFTIGGASRCCLGDEAADEAAKVSCPPQNHFTSQHFYCLSLVF